MYRRIALMMLALGLAACTSSAVKRLDKQVAALIEQRQTMTSGPQASRAPAVVPQMGDYPAPEGSAYGPVPPTRNPQSRT